MRCGVYVLEEKTAKNMVYILNHSHAMYVQKNCSIRHELEECFDKERVNFIKVKNRIQSPRISQTDRKNGLSASLKQ